MGDVVYYISKSWPFILLSHWPVASLPVAQWCIYVYIYIVESMLRANAPDFHPSYLGVSDSMLAFIHDQKVTHSDWDLQWITSNHWLDSSWIITQQFLCYIFRLSLLIHSFCSELWREVYMTFILLKDLSIHFMRDSTDLEISTVLNLTCDWVR